MVALFKVIHIVSAIVRLSYRVQNPPRKKNVLVFLIISVYSFINVPFPKQLVT